MTLGQLYSGLEGEELRYTRRHDTAVVSSSRLLYPELLRMKYVRHLPFAK